ncbi:cutinase family protein [Gordonia sp. (in: high G+C Gram-positive bacteria)]|uniref:cutinase family protein n=1 Tax=Gordonia sp. (in: high G+C Gram-positive bacteria) TaxID=84139 RepID=UPI00261D0142|nr:cutinase family protein [Gordonia sp. (in: high G+C Gram-positive bacteria)]
MRRHARKLAWGVGLLALVALVLVIVLIIQFLRPSPPPPGPPTSPPTSAPPHRPNAQPADCPDVLVLSIPGTWESKSNDDPYHPTANPKSLMLRVTSALQEKFPRSRAEVYTVPYVAQFRNPTVLGDNQRDYDWSRHQGRRKADAKLTATHEHCPLTRYILMGFSQGAVITGDIASDIGNGKGPIPAADQDLVLGVGLIADGRRVSGEQHDVGPSPQGQGAEVSLGGLRIPGITMSGKRTGGFGTLTDRTYSICAPGDLICDAPQITNPFDAVGKFANAANNPVHAMYAKKKYWSDDGATATQWMLRWATALIEQAPRPKHR